MPTLTIDFGGRSASFELGPVETLGRSKANTLIVEHSSIAAEHAGLEQRDGRTLLYDLGSSSGTWVGRDRNRGEATVLEHGEVLQIGALRATYTEGFADWGKIFVGEDRLERRLAVDLRRNPDDEGARQVYADWLEESGHPDRAAYLRLDPAAFRAGEPVAQALDGAFRAVWARAPIESCARPGGCVPSRWDRLENGPGTRRYCEACNSDVAYCRSAAEARRSVASRLPVAIDPAAARARGDLELPALGAQRLDLRAGEAFHSAALIVSDGDARWLHVLRGEAFVGRDPSADVVLGVPVSRRHLRLFSAGEDWFVEDTQSTSGTFVNHSRVFGPVRLRHEDELLLSDRHRLWFRAASERR